MLGNIGFIIIKGTILAGLQAKMALTPCSLTEISTIKYNNPKTENLRKTPQFQCLIFVPKHFSESEQGLGVL